MNQLVSIPYIFDDIVTLLMCASGKELATIDSALCSLDPVWMSERGRLPRENLEDVPHALGESVMRVARSVSVYYGEPFVDLAANALKMADLTLPDMADQVILDAAIRQMDGEKLGSAGDIGRLAFALATIRSKIARRAALFGAGKEWPMFSRLPDLPNFAGRLVSGVRGTVGSVSDYFSTLRPTSSSSPTFEVIAKTVERLPLVEQLRKEAEEAQQRMGKVNIMIAGRSGAGKSTLVNAVFGEKVAEVGSGRPVTSDITWFEPANLPVRLCDTQGLEMADYAKTLDAISSEIKRCNLSGKPEDRIHVVWLCIQEPSSRIEAGEERLAALCNDSGIPVMVVLTKAIGPRLFQNRVREIIPMARDVVRVLAEDWDDVTSYGLSDLISRTEKLLPEMVKAAFDAAQQVDIERKRSRALDIARGASAAAAAAAATPIPIADAAAVFSVNVGMVAGIATVMGVRMDRSNLATIAGTLVGALGAAAGGRLIASQALKLVPGMGSIAGGAIGSALAASATYGLGYGLIEFFCRFYADSHRMPDGDEIRDGFRDFWQSWENKETLPKG